MADKTDRVRSAEKSAVYLRNYQRARSRALTRLANLYNDTYKQLLDEEFKADEETGKKWLDISGTTLVPAVNSGSTNGSHTDTQTE
jgi:hypothetical protein